jgi:hypothetical protein
MQYSQHNSHTHWLAAQCLPQTKASQRVCLPSPEKEIFKNAPHATKTKDKDGDTVRQQMLLNRLTMWIENKKNEKHDAPTWYIKNWADSGKFQVCSSHQTFGLGGHVIAPKCPTFHIPETL